MEALMELVSLIFEAESKNVEVSKGIEAVMGVMVELEKKNAELSKENQELKDMFDNILSTLNARAMWATDEPVGK